MHLGFYSDEPTTGQDHPQGENWSVAFNTEMRDMISGNNHDMNFCSKVRGARNCVIR